MNDENLKRGNPATQFKAGREQVEIARKGGYARAAAKRKKDALRKNLKWMLAIKPELTDAQREKLREQGYDPDYDYTAEDLITIGLIQRALKDDRSLDTIYRYLEEDPLTRLEEKRIKVQEEAVILLLLETFLLHSVLDAQQILSGLHGGVHLEGEPGAVHQSQRVFRILL